MNDDTDTITMICFIDKKMKNNFTQIFFVPSHCKLTSKSIQYHTGKMLLLWVSFLILVHSSELLMIPHGQDAKAMPPPPAPSTPRKGRVSSGKGLDGDNTPSKSPGKSPGRRSGD